jgi:hypothetical protein
MPEMSADDPIYKRGGYYIGVVRHTWTPSHFGLNDFQWKMFSLDVALTGQASDALHNMRQKRHWMTAMEWLSSYDMWYLADGGYSRICFDFDTQKLFLASESSSRAKALWKQHGELIAAAECRAAIAEGI